VEAAEVRMSARDTTDDGLPLDPAKRKAAVEAQFDHFRAQLGTLTPRRKTLPTRPSDVIYAVRAKDQFEAFRHCKARAGFLPHVVADSRTRDLFAFWSQQTGVGAVRDDMIALVDNTAARAGFAHRSALRRQENAHHLLPILGVLQQREEQYERLLVDTQEARARFAIHWVVAELPR
jgi:hypothetical protein